MKQDIKCKSRAQLDFINQEIVKSGCSAGKGSPGSLRPAYCHLYQTTASGSQIQFENWKECKETGDTSEMIINLYEYDQDPVTH